MNSIQHSAPDTRERVISAARGALTGTARRVSAAISDPRGTLAYGLQDAGAAIMRAGHRVHEDVFDGDAWAEYNQGRQDGAREAAQRIAQLLINGERPLLITELEAIATAAGVPLLDLVNDLWPAVPSGR